MKKTIRLTENELKRIISESTRKVLNEIERSHPNDIPPGDEDIYYPCDINPDVWDALQRGDYGQDDNSEQAYKYVKESFGKQANGGRLQENKLRKLIKKSVKKALCETSYDFVRKAHKAACDKRKFDQAERLHKHLVNKSSERFDPNMPVIIVGGDLQGRYTAQEIVDNFDINGYVKPSPNPIYTDSQLIGYPKIRGYLGPMWDGDKIRYESQDAYDFFSM